MSLHFCIDAVLDDLERIEDPRSRFSAMIRVSETPQECGGYPDDGFVLDNVLNVLNLDSADGATKLALLLEEVPLFHFNVELALDRALEDRHKNPAVAQALVSAFGSRRLPGAVGASQQQQQQQAAGDFVAGLRHPALGDTSIPDLARIYADFLAALDAPAPEYNFEKAVLGKHLARFSGEFTGFVSKGEGLCLAEFALTFARRRDHDPGASSESAVDAGHRKARRMAVGDPLELVWAWLEADQFQMRRCRDIDRIMKLGRMKKQPRWIKADLSCLLEKEAMKQFFAETLAQKNAPLARALQQDAPALKRALDVSAGRQSDEILQQLITQMLGVDAVYSGTAGKFMLAAQARQREAKACGFV